MQFQRTELELATNLPIVLPSFLSPTTVAASLRGVPIVGKSDDAGSLRACFAPHPRVRTITLDARGVRGGTAEGTCCAIIAREWLTQNAPPDVSVTLIPPENADAIPVDPDLRGTELAVWKTTARQGNLGPLRIPIPPEEELSSDSRREFIDSISARIREQLLPVVHPDNIGAWATRLIDEFVVEGLLNVSQHAGEAGDATNAWLATRLWSPESLAALKPTELWRGSDRWLERQTQNGATGYLELCIADAGVGVAASLVDAYLARRPEIRASLDRREGWWAVHDEVLSWAFSPFGSRKVTIPGTDATFGRAWRGLYRVRFRSAQLGALLCLRSGLGMFGEAAMGGDRYELRLAPIGDKLERRPMPWTILTLLLPLPIAHAPNAEEGTRLVTPDHYAYIPNAKQPLVGEHLGGGRADYARTVRESVRASVRDRAVISQRTAETPSILAVVHPFIRLESPTQQSSAYAKSKTLRIEDETAVQLLELLTDSSLPGLTPIHLFVDVPINALEEAQKYFAERNRDTAGEPLPPEICALCHPATNRIHWFVQVDNCADAAVLAIDGSVEAPTDAPIPDWWFELQHLFPWFAMIDFEESPVTRLRVVAPTEVSNESTMAALIEMLPAAAATAPSRHSWFWSAAGPGTELIRTTSGRLVPQFVSANALCAAEPVAEIVLAATLRRLIESYRRTDIVTLVPDTGASSYVLAKRLLRELPTIVILHPEDLDTDKEQTDIIVFADAIFAGSLVADRVGRLPDPSRFRGVVAALDLRPTSIRKDLSWPFSAAVTWPFPEEVSHPVQGADILEVDEITNEVLTSRLAAEVRGYTSILWQPPDGAERSPVRDEERPVLLQPSRFRYGLQWVGDRIHVVRCSTVDLLRDDAVFAIIVQWLASVLARLLRDHPDYDAIVIARDANPLRHELIRLFTAAVNTSTIQELEWTGGLYGCTIETTRHRGRQILRHHLNAVIRAAIPIAHAKRPAAKQRKLFEWPPPHTDAAILYIDNGAVTGHAIRDIALSVADLTHPRPAVLQLLVFINKLPPSEERLLHDIQSISRADGGSLPILFDALLQLRIPTFERFEATSLARYIANILAACRGIDLDEVQRWIDDIAAVAAYIADSSGTEAVQCAMGPLAEHSEVSVEAILFRHLIAIHQQGLPVIEAIVHCLHRLTKANDYSVITVLALEPDLLTDALLSGPLSNDIGELAFAALSQGAPLGVRRNALFVALQLHGYITGRAAEVARTALLDTELRGELVGLSLAQPAGAFRDRFLRSVIEAGDDVLRNETTGRRVERALPYLRAGLKLPLHQRSLSDDAARVAIETLISAARPYHDRRDFGAWWTLHSVAKESLPESVASALLRSIDWGNVEHFFHETVVPAMYAMGQLRRRGRFPLGSAEDLARDALLALEQAKSVALRVDAGTDLATFRDAWLNVQRRTLSTAVNVIYTQERATVLGGDKSGGTVDTLLTSIVQEPVGLMLHSIAGAFDDRQMVDLVTSGGLVRTLRAPVGQHLLWLNDVWTGSAQLPVIWRQADTLRRCYHVFADNIRRRGATDPEIVLVVNLAPNALQLSLENRRSFDPVDRVRQGTGLRQAEEATRRLGGDMQTDETVTTFRVVQNLPIEWLPLNRRDQ